MVLSHGFIQLRKGFCVDITGGYPIEGVGEVEGGEVPSKLTANDFRYTCVCCIRIFAPSLLNAGAS